MPRRDIADVPPSGARRRPRPARVGGDTARFLETGCETARALLRRNLTHDGLLAAARTPAATERGYTNVFARDAAVGALAMVLSGEPGLIEGAAAGLRTLARHQADNGQIPKFVDPARADADFWYLGCIDATLWWLVAVEFVTRQAPRTRLASKLREPIERAIRWLRCQEHPRLFLLQQNEASDWADIMPRSGFVLYTNALWYHVKRLYGLTRAPDTHRHFNQLFHPFSENVPEYRRLRLLTDYVRSKARHRELYLSFVNFSFWGDEGDTLGNLLAILFGLADRTRARRILNALERAHIHRPWPVRSVVAPIRRTDRLWRAYMMRHRQNLAHQYHNGGSWPMIGGFWVMALAAHGRAEQARAELQRLAQMNAVNGWEFNEWFHGKTGEPRGMPGQSWSAAMLLLAAASLERKIF